MSLLGGPGPPMEDWGGVSTSALWGKGPGSSGLGRMCGTGAAGGVGLTDSGLRSF